MRTLALRVFALLLALLLPAAAAADTYLSREDAVHVDFTLGVGLHADGFPQGGAHWKDWETFLSRLDPARQPGRAGVPHARPAACI